MPPDYSVTNFWAYLEVRRRERVIRIFPTEASALRLIGALLAEINDDWQCRKYLAFLGECKHSPAKQRMAEFHDWNRGRNAGEKEETVIAI